MHKKTKRYRLSLLFLAVVFVATIWLFENHRRSVESRASQVYTSFHKRDWPSLYDHFFDQDVSKREISKQQFTTAMNYLVADAMIFEIKDQIVQSRKDATGYRQAEAKISRNGKDKFLYFGMYFDGTNWGTYMVDVMFNGARIGAKATEEMYARLGEAMKIANIKRIVDQADGIQFTVESINAGLSQKSGGNFTLPFRQAGY